jgi:hypothetical protein
MNIYTVTYKTFSTSTERTCTVVTTTVEKAIVGARKVIFKRHYERKPVILAVMKTGEVDRVER